MTKRTRSDSGESINWGKLDDDDVVDFLRDPFEEYEETFIDDKLVSIEVIPDGKHKIKIINVNNKENKKFYNEEISHLVKENKTFYSYLVIEGSWKDNKKNGNFTITKYITSFSILLFKIECIFADDVIVQNELVGLTSVFFGDFNHKSIFIGLISEFDESNGGHFSLINGTLSFNQGNTYYEGDFENWRYNGTGHYYTEPDGGNDFGFSYTGKFLNNKFINGCIHVFANLNNIRIDGDFSNQTSLLNLDGNYSVEFLNVKFNDVDVDSASDVDSDFGEYDEYQCNKYKFKIKFSSSALTRDIEEGCVYCEWCRDTVQGINLTNYNLRSKGNIENTCLFCREEKPLIVFKNCRHKLYCIDCIRIIVDRKYEKLKKKVDYLFRSFTIYCDKFLTLKE